MSELSEARGALMTNTSAVMQLRNSVLIQQLLKSFKQSKKYQLDEEALLDELADVNTTSTVKNFNLDGTAGLSQAAERRFAVQGARDRVVAINQNLRSVLLGANRIYRTGLVYIRSQPEVQGLTAKATEDLASIALDEITEVISSVDRLMSETKEVLTNLDDRSRVVDAWFALHKQYVFMTLNRGNNGGEEEKGRRLGSASRRD